MDSKSVQTIFNIWIFTFLEGLYCTSSWNVYKTQKNYIEIL